MLCLRKFSFTQVGLLRFMTPIPSWWLGVGVAGPPAACVSADAAASALIEREPVIGIVLTSSENVHGWLLENAGAIVNIPVVSVDDGIADLRVLRNDTLCVSRCVCCTRVIN